MAVINDRTRTDEGCWPKPEVIIQAADHADKLTCRLCGKQYVSSGKCDPGFCRDCLREMDEENATLMGGPLDGHKAHE